MNPTDIAEQLEAGHAEAEALPEDDRLKFLAEDVAQTDLLTYEPQDHDDRILCAYLRRNQQIQSEIARVKEQTAAMLKALESRLNRLNWVYLPSVQRIVSDKLRGRKEKSLKRPWGTAGYRTQPKHLEIKDEHALLANAVVDDLPFLIVPPPEISKSKLNEYFEKTGDLPAGVELVPATEKFYAK